MYTVLSSRGTIALKECMIDHLCLRNYGMISQLSCEGLLASAALQMHDAFCKHAQTLLCVPNRGGSIGNEQWGHSIEI